MTSATATRAPATWAPTKTSRPTNVGAADTISTVARRSERAVAEAGA